MNNTMSKPILGVLLGISILCACIGYEILNENPVGWLLLVGGTIIPCGLVIHIHRHYKK